MKELLRAVYYLCPFALGAASNALIGWMFVAEKSFDNPFLEWLLILAPGILLQFAGGMLLARFTPVKRKYDVVYALLTVIGAHVMLLLVDPLMTGGWLIHGVKTMWYLPSIPYYGALFVLTLLCSHRLLRTNTRKEAAE